MLTIEAQIATLTADEHQIILLVSKGLRNKQIAQQLALSEATVHCRLASIFRKLEVTDRLDLLIYAYRYGLAPLPRSSPCWPFSFLLSA